MDELHQFVPNVHFELIPIKDLVSNQNYQRNLSLVHVKRTVDHFDPYQINPVKVSRRNGVNYVFDGQHTIEIVATASESRETPVWCMIYDDLEYTEEADIFANQKKYVKPLLPYEIFMANIEAGNEKQLLIKELVESYHLTIGSTKLPGTICAVSTLENIHDKYGFHTLDRVLRLCIGTWEGDVNSLSGNMLNGVARLISAYGDEIKDDVFRDKVGHFSAKEISRIAKDRRAGSLGYSEAMLLAYNRKMRNPLKWTTLYADSAIPHDVIDDSESDEDCENEDSTLADTLPEDTQEEGQENQPLDLQEPQQNFEEMQSAYAAPATPLVISA